MVEIPVSKGYVALVDDEDAHLAELGSWIANPNWRTVYAMTTICHPGWKQKITLHRAVMGFGPGDPRIDHVNGNGLDCRRSNLRVVTHAENIRNMRVPRTNTSGFKGVIRQNQKTGRMWRAQLKTDGRTHGLGSYCTAEEAARAYDAEARKRFGAFAALNFPEPGERSARALSPSREGA